MAALIVSSSLRVIFELKTVIFSYHTAISNTYIEKRKPLYLQGKLLFIQQIYGHKNKQITGIEPAFPAWEAGVLPMNHICILPV